MKAKWKLLLLAVLALGLLYLHDQYHVPLETILAWQPDNLLLAAVVILLGYAVKSILVFVPIMIPQILAGHLYPRETAIFINLLGLVIVMSVPYLLGRYKGQSEAETLLKKFPKLQIILQLQEENKMAFCFMLRACAVPPADIVTMYLGATGMSFTPNVVGGVLGYFPGMILSTILGANIRNPESPAFWLSLGLNVAWVLLSALSFYLYKKYIPRKEAAE